ncbi:hypothetical protein N656DRAFT_760266 [Canariomyces notabilis]|uniref:SMP domain-containing protein n=1 Tax=Canariomyces notabilis TaxID=2074819 RepID=A0AAN6QFD9_9PEZI|nr:hypothetical protein N656DRAFT_760266 [Canariomyces arenarius]
MASNKNEMTKSDSSRIQSTQARSGGDMGASGFAARAESAGDRNAASQAGSGSQGTGSGQGSTGSGASSGAKK